MRAGEMRDRIWEGTESMSASARERVVAARTSAYRAQAKIEAQAARRKDDLVEFAKNEPLMLGAVAFAVGAAAGAIMPRSDVEDEYIGDYRDQVFDRADAIFREESAKLKAVASAAASEGRDIVEEKLDTVRAKADGKLDDAEDVIDRAKDGVDAAKQRADEAIKAAKTQTPTGQDAVDKVEGEVRSAADRISDAAKKEADKQNLGGSV